MLWSDLVATLAVYCQQEQADPSFTAATPTFVSNAELKIYRALDLAASSGPNLSLSTAAGVNLIDLTQMTGQTLSDGSAVFSVFPVVVQAVSARVAGRWVPYQWTGQDFLEMVWPDEALQAAPSPGMAYACPLDDTTIKLAPTPDDIYPLRIQGQWRPAPMSPTNPVTWLGTNIPDLLFAGVMAEALTYQRDFGAGSSDPQALPAWQTAFGNCLKSAMVEEQVRKLRGPGYLPYMPAPLAASAPQ